MNGRVFERAVIFGLAAGMRTSAPLVAAARSPQPPEWYALLGELLIDKLPMTPSRLMPGAWLARVGTAAFGAYRDADRCRDNLRAEAAIVAGITATLATKIFHDVRGAVSRNRIPDPLVAVVEDALMLACVVHLRDTGGDET